MKIENWNPVLVRLIFLTISLLLALVASASAADRRVALVIGNSQYRHVNLLPNPVNDASAIAASLRELDFEVTLLMNGTKSDFERVLGDFSETASGSDLALVFYAGHGLEMDGVNYLIPVDAKLKTDLRVPLESVALGTVLDSISGARKLRMVLLDACRNNPFAAKITRSVGSTRSVGRGLADVKAGPNELISYAAAAGSEAADGLGLHSPYTTSLLANIDKPNVEVGKLFRIVAAEVQASTNGLQVPYESSRLPPQDIFLKEVSIPAVVPEKPIETTVEPEAEKKSSPAANAMEEWKLVKESGSPDVIRAYLKKYRDDELYRILAEQELAALQPKESKETVSVRVPEPEIKTGRAPETLCDVLAAAPEDPLKLSSVEGVLVEEIDARAAKSACEKAISDYPREPRFKYQYARVLSASKSYASAKELLMEAWSMGYSTSASSLGLYYAYGYGVEADGDLALDWYLKGKKANNALAVCNLAGLYITGTGVQRDLRKASTLADECLSMGLSRGYLVKATALSLSERYDEAATALFAGLNSGSQPALFEMIKSDGRWPAEFKKALQIKLSEEGFYVGPADGEFGEKTKAALRAVYDRGRTR